MIDAYYDHMSHLFPSDSIHIFGHVARVAGPGPRFRIVEDGIDRMGLVSIVFDHDTMLIPQSPEHLDERFLASQMYHYCLINPALEYHPDPFAQTLAEYKEGIDLSEADLAVLPEEPVFAIELIEGNPKGWPVLPSYTRELMHSHFRRACLREIYCMIPEYGAVFQELAQLRRNLADAKEREEFEACARLSQQVSTLEARWLMIESGNLSPDILQ
ncbi:hypothetical protein HYT54_05340 [Candidatus Woesearchaeota archaeon]|nr:hypothetical protein [Candidatus Woesearchaeota archaeon]